MRQVNIQQEMLEKFRWIVKVRFWAAFIILLSLGICRIAGWLIFPFFLFSLAPLLEMFVNQPYPWIARRLKRPERLFIITLIFDILIITYGIHFVGGMNIFVGVLVYPLVFIFAGLVLTPKITYFLANLSFVSYATLVYLEYHGIIPSVPSINIDMPGSARLSFAFLILPFYNLMVYFIIYLTAMIRKGENELRISCNILKEMQGQLIQSEKMASIGLMAAGVAHEINNPLAVIAGEAEMLLKDKDKDKDTKDVSKAIVTQSKRIKAITEGLLHFSQKRQVKFDILDVNKVIEDAIGLLKYQAKFEGIEIIRQLDPDMPKISGDKNQLQEVFINIMQNGIEAMKKFGKLTVKTYTEKAVKYGRRATDVFKSGETIAVIEFIDTGSGMDEETLKKIFDPFFTTKDNNTGLGLSICYSIVKSHNGAIDASSKLGQGATFFVKLPIAKPRRG